jgi:hypothetical protein
MTATKTLSEKVLEADLRASKYLGDANEAAERGNDAKANKLYEKCQFWLDRLNKLNGDA